MLLHRHHTQINLPDLKSLGGRDIINTSNFVENTDCKDATVIGLSRDKKFITVGGRREYKVLKIEQDAP